MIEPQIKALRVIDARAYKNGDRLIADFTATFAGMTVHGLQLVRTGKGGFKAISPAVTRSDGRQAIRFDDHQAHHRLTEAARSMYRLMGGEFWAYARQTDVDDEVGEGNDLR